MYAAIVNNEIVENVIIVDDINVFPNLVEIPEGKFIHIGDNIKNMVDVGVHIEQPVPNKTTPTVL
jgi:hypothetical protein